MSKRDPTTQNSLLFSCSHCSYSCKTKYNLGLHEVIHLDKKLWEFKCDQCNYRGKRKKDLNGHLKTHSEDKPHRCPQEGCNYRSRWSHTISDHYDRIHRNTRPFQCSRPGCEYRGKQIKTWCSTCDKFTELRKGTLPVQFVLVHFADIVNCRSIRGSTQERNPTNVIFPVANFIAKQESIFGVTWRSTGTPGPINAPNLAVNLRVNGRRAFALTRKPTTRIAPDLSNARCVRRSCMTNPAGQSI